MLTAQAAAPEIDRLVIGVMRAIEPRHGDTIRATVDELGMESMGPLSVFAEHLSAGPMPESLIALRLRYVWVDDAHRVFDELVAAGLLQRIDSVFTAADRMVPLLDAIAHAKAETAQHVWEGEEALVEALLEPARRIALNASENHELAVIHRELPEPDQSPARLLARLTTLRYIRHHCHVRAWEDEGLTGEMMPALTALWNGEGTDTGVDRLVEQGLTEGEPVRLTLAARATRDRIELATDDCTQVSFDALGAGTASKFLENLRRLAV